MSQSNSQLYLSPDQEDLLLTALNSNQPSSRPARNSIPNMNGSGSLYHSPAQQTPGSGQLSLDVDDSPYLDFDGEFDDSYNFDLNGPQMIGDLPSASTGPASSSADEDHDLHDKRKDVDGKEDGDEGGGKRREGDEKTAKKPGRKPLTSEPTSVSSLVR